MAQEPIVHINSLTDTIIGITKWKVNTEDNPAFAFSDGNNKGWDNIASINQYLRNDTTPSGIIWVQSYITIDSSLQNTISALEYDCKGAMELYLDGKLLTQQGIIANTADKQVNEVSSAVLIPIYFSNKSKYLISIRYSLYDKTTIAQTTGLYVSIGKAESLQIRNKKYAKLLVILVGIAGILFALGFLHLLMFFFYKKEIENILYFVFVFSAGFILLNEYLQIYSESFLFFKITYNLEIFSLLTVFFFLHRLSSSFFIKIRKWYSILLISLYTLASISIFIELLDISMSILPIITGIDTIRILIYALIKRKKNAYIVATGFLLFIGILLLNLYADALGIQISTEVGLIGIYAGFLSIPASISIYLALKITRNTINLEIQLVKVKELSQITIAQEQEKKLILENQKDELEKQVKERTFQLNESNEELNNTNEKLYSTLEVINSQKEQIEQKNKNITDSINYAACIQLAILGNLEQIETNIGEGFVFFSPHSIVSGDFYWYTKLNNLEIIIAADCTGHGVPGAFMTVMGSNFLEEIIKNKKTVMPDKILYELDEKITGQLRGKESANKVNDGMDISILTFDRQNKKIYFSGAKNPLYYIRAGEMNVIKGSRASIGGLELRKEQSKVFELHEIDVQQNDTFYIFSDGFQDQYSKEDRKYLTKNFRNFLHKLSELPISEQKGKLKDELVSWKGDNHQTDDILVIGLKY